MLKPLPLAFTLFVSAPLVISAADAPARTDHKSSEHSPEKPADKTAGESDKDKSKSGEPKEQLVESKHSVTINGQKIEYTAKAGTILLRDIEDKPTAAIFYIAYTQDGVGDPARRPITFSFNGGPGSSSVWLHLGLLGPRRVRLEEDG